MCGYQNAEPNALSPLSASRITSYEGQVVGGSAGAVTELKSMEKFALLELRTKRSLADSGVKCRIESPCDPIRTPYKPVAVAFDTSKGMRLAAFLKAITVSVGGVYIPLDWDRFWILRYAAKMCVECGLLSPRPRLLTADGKLEQRSSRSCTGGSSPLVVGTVHVEDVAESNRIGCELVVTVGVDDGVVPRLGRLRAEAS